MATGRIRCTVVETHDEPGSEPRSQDLLPWADPYIAKLVDKYRLRAALDDSLRFLETEAVAHVADAATNVTPEPSAHWFDRWTQSGDQAVPPLVDRWKRS